MNTNRVDHFLTTFRHRAKQYAKRIERAQVKNPESFSALGEIILQFAENVIGDEYIDVLIDGYIFFVNNVNRHQIEYEQNKRYKYSNYAQVRSSVYSNVEVMNKYHWGVLVTTFAWAHHLDLYDFFVRSFLGRLSEGPTGAVAEFGSGSAIWSILAMSALPEWRARAVDISETSVLHSREMVNRSGLGERIDVAQADALIYFPAESADAAISCFLLEHLEQPLALLRAIALTLKPSGLAFVTAALTAAEVDHIFEFRKESELVLLFEQAGFRVIEMYSAAPVSLPTGLFFLPRSAGFVVQKKHGEIW